MRISKADIEAIKKEHALKAVIESYGIKFRKKGANYVGLCPFHKEKVPSFTVNPKTNLYHCFGCNAGGDVIGFITKQEGIGFREAFERLNGNGKNGKKPLQKKAPSSLIPKAFGTPAQPVNRTRLLNRVVSFYHKSFCEDQRAMEYLYLYGQRRA